MKGALGLTRVQRRYHSIFLSKPLYRSDDHMARRVGFGIMVSPI